MIKRIQISAPRTPGGAELLHATQLDDGQWAYFAEETQRYYLVRDDDMEDLDRRLAAGEPDPYSRWCAETDAREMPIGWVPARDW